MNLKQLREEAWTIARDNAIVDSDKLWPKAEMNTYINRVYRHIARETKCITDAVTPSVCQIASTPVDYTTLTVADGLDYTWANDPNSWLYQKNVAPYLYDLHPSILQIDEIKWTSRQWKLVKVSVTKWQKNPWWEQVIGLPTEYATDLSNGKIALNYRSETADTMRLQIRRLPLVDLVNDTDTPEFRTSYHDLMVNGILMWMYGKQDSESFDMEKRNNYEARFLRDIDEIKQQETILERRLLANHSMSAFR